MKAGSSASRLRFEADLGRSRSAIGTFFWMASERTTWVSIVKPAQRSFNVCQVQTNPSGCKKPLKRFAMSLIFFDEQASQP